MSLLEKLQQKHAEDGGPAESSTGGTPEVGIDFGGQRRVDYCKLPEPHGTWARWVVEQAVAEVQKARGNAEEVDMKDPATQSISPLGSVSDFLNPIFFTTWFST